MSLSRCQRKVLEFCSEIAHTAEEIFEHLGKHHNGRTGIAEHIDSLGQLHGRWGRLAVIPETDDSLLKSSHNARIRH